MYKIFCDERTLHDVRDEDYMLLSPKLALELNKTGNFDFGILPSHPEIGRIKKLKSSIKVYDNDELLYTGRPTTDESDFYNLGQVSCEGELAFLLDSIQRPHNYGSQTAEVSSNIEIFKKLIEEHNSQVEKEKQFEIGIIDIDSEIVTSLSTNYEKTWDFINSNFIGKYDGYLRVRHKEGVRYLDYVKQYGKISTQEIRFGENLLDLKRYIKANDIVTAIIPIGKNNVTIKNANGHNGTDYIYDKDAVELYGWIWKKVDFSDVNDPDTLFRRASEHLKESVNLAITIELTAADLHLVDVDVGAIRLGDMVPCISKRHGLLSTLGDVSTYFQVSKYELNPDNPSSNKLTLGRTVSTLTAQVVKSVDADKKVKNVEQIVDKTVGDVKQIKEDVEGISENVTEVKKDVNQTKESITTLDEKTQNLSDSVKEIEGYSEKIQSLEIGIDELKTLISEEQKVIQDILMRLQVLEEGGASNS